MSSTVQLVDHCVDSLRTSQVLARLVASGDIAPHVPSASLRSSSARPLRVPPRPVQARPSPASALPLALGSALLRALLPSPPSVCSTPPPSLPPALSATQAPWRLPSAGFPGVHPPSLVPLVSSFLTACAGSGSHTGRSMLRVCPSARLSCIPMRPRRHAVPGTCRNECILQSIHAVFASLPAQGCACPAAIPRCIL